MAKNVKHSFLPRLARNLRLRLEIFFLLVTKLRCFRAIGAKIYDSPGGMLLFDVWGNIHPLFWFKDQRLPFETLQNLNKHDFSLARFKDVGMSSEPEVGDFMAKYVLLNDSKRVLELGSYLGYTSSHIAVALAALEGDRSLTLVDADPELLEIAKENCEIATKGAIVPKALCGFSTQTSTLKQLLPPYDLIFIDTAHDEETTLAEVEIYSRLLSESGVLILHDAIQWPGVRRAIFQNREKFDAMVFSTSRTCGLALMRLRHR